MVRAFLFGIVLLVCAASVQARQSATPGGDVDSYVILVPDAKNDVVRKITPAGDYLGDFLDPARFESNQPAPALWASPRVLLYVEGEPPSLWLAAERALTQWGTDGRFLRTIHADTVDLEDPTGMVRVGDEIFVLSEDKRRMLVFDLGGTLLRQFADEALYQAKDLKVGEDGRFYIAGRMAGARPGLVSIWDVGNADKPATVVDYRIAPDSTGDNTWWLGSLVFDDDGDLLVTEFSRGRVERWSVRANTRTEVLLDSPEGGAYQKLVRGPDGLVYMAGPRGLYRFDSRARAQDLERLTPFFDVGKLSDHHQHPFTPGPMLFVPRTALMGSGEQPARE